MYSKSTFEMSLKQTNNINLHLISQQYSFHLENHEPRNSEAQTHPSQRRGHLREALCLPFSNGETLFKLIVAEK